MKPDQSVEAGQSPFVIRTPEAGVTDKMREKELRLGVVLAGGVSLALYIHGVSRELLKLVRASRAFHARDRNDGTFPEAYSNEAGTMARSSDTEAVYFDLLKQLAPELEYADLVWWDMLFGTWVNPRENILRCGFDPDREARWPSMLAFHDVNRD